jgi:aryl-alcohol dehydrogenase-like predicted oxidoreductase
MFNEKVLLKHSNLNVSRLCFGGCPMGQFGWGRTDKESFVNAINLAVNNGINFFDTADIYGVGEAEKTLGETIYTYRSKVFVATKFGVRIKNGKSFYDNSPEWIEKALSDSLKRLQTNYVDIYQIHYRDATPINIVMEKLISLKRKGLIRYIGLSNVLESSFEEYIPYKDHIISFQNEFSLANQKNRNNLLLTSNKLDITPMTWGSLGQGILTGKYNLENTKFDKDDRRSREIYSNFHGDKLIHNLKIVDVMKQISQRINKSVSSIAVRWILDTIPNSVVLAGIKNTTQLLQNAEGLDWHLSNKDLEILNMVSQFYE